MNNNNDISSILIQNWISENLSSLNVEQTLTNKGYDADTINQYLKEFNRVKRTKKQFIGFALMGIGAFLGFLSCVLTITNPFPQLYNIILYGLTMFAITIILIGLYYVFE